MILSLSCRESSPENVGTNISKFRKMDLLPFLRERQFTGVVSTDYKMASNSVKHQMFETQETIIKLQSELLACKNEQLESLQTSVKSSVGESVKAEFQSYSSVLQANCPESQKPVSSEMIKKAVKTVVQEEDRNKNLMIFGLSEQDNEELSTVVSEVFSAIGEKPRIEAS